MAELKRDRERAEPLEAVQAQRPQTSAPHAASGGDPAALRRLALALNGLRRRRAFLRRRPELIAPNLAKINAIFSRAYLRLGRLHLECGQVRQARFWLRKAHCHGRLSGRDAWLRWAAHLPAPVARMLAGWVGKRRKRV